MSHSYAPWSNPPYRYPSMLISSLLLFSDWRFFASLLVSAACPFPESPLGIPRGGIYFLTVAGFCHAFSRHSGDSTPHNPGL